MRIPGMHKLPHAHAHVVTAKSITHTQAHNSAHMWAAHVCVRGRCDGANPDAQTRHGVMIGVAAVGCLLSATFAIG